MKQVITLTLPAHWASALINHDRLGLDAGEIELIEQTSKLHGFSMYSAVSCSEEAFITAWHDADMQLMCECFEYSFLREVTE